MEVAVLWPYETGLLIESFWYSAFGQNYNFELSGGTELQVNFIDCHIFLFFISLYIYFVADQPIRQQAIQPSHAAPSHAAPSRAAPIHSPGLGGRKFPVGVPQQQQHQYNIETIKEDPNMADTDILVRQLF